MNARYHHQESTLNLQKTMIKTTKPTTINIELTTTIKQQNQHQQKQQNQQQQQQKINNNNKKTTKNNNYKSTLNLRTTARSPH